MTPKWQVVYEKAIRDDGSLLFPERLTHDFLENARRTQGSYIFANQYQNEIIPEGEKVFKPHWIRYFDAKNLPSNLYTFAFVDPAISLQDTADYTALVVVSVDTDKNWYVRHSRRERLNPSQLIDLLFRTQDAWKPMIIGIEDVAFQRAIIHFGFEEMKRRGIQLPITGIKRGPDKTKEMRIMSLVPRFEWGTLLLALHQNDLELELSQFPRGAHNDILDSLSSINDIVYYPSPIRGKNEPPNPHDPGYEHWYIEQLTKRQSEGGGRDS